MRLLALARTLPFHSAGGMQSVAWDLLRAFAQRGHDVTVLTTALPDHRRSFEAEGVSIVPIDRTTPERCDRTWWSGSRAYAGSSLGRQPDAVLSISAAGAGLLPLRERWKRTPFVFQAHGTSWGEVVSKWQSGRTLQRAKAARNLYWLFKDAFIYRKFDRIVAVGDVVQQQLRHWPHTRLTPGLDVDVIRNGIDTQLFKPDAAARAEVRRQQGWGAEDRVAVFAARLHPQKGGAQAIRAFERLPASPRTTRLLIVGLGAEEIALRQQAQQSSAAARVHFTGSVDREKMPALLAAGDAFVFPSLRQEGLPMNVLEALACGLPPLCASHMRPVFDSTLPISFADPNDADAMAAALGAALHQGASDKSLLSSSYTLKECASRYLSLFERLRAA